MLCGSQASSSAYIWSRAAPALIMFRETRASSTCIWSMAAPALWQNGVVVPQTHSLYSLTVYKKKFADPNTMLEKLDIGRQSDLEPDSWFTMTWLCHPNVLAYKPNF